jgi:hypothetical protein
MRLYCSLPLNLLVEIIICGVPFLSLYFSFEDSVMDSLGEFLASKLTRCSCREVICRGQETVPLQALFYKKKKQI